MFPETRVFQAADGENLVILACTVFDWSTHVMDGQMDGRTELRWLRGAKAVAAFVHKKTGSEVRRLRHYCPRSKYYNDRTLQFSICNRLHVT